MAERNALGHSMGLRDSDAIRHTLQFRYLRDSRERHIRQKTGERLFTKERNRLEWRGRRVFQEGSLRADNYIFFRIAFFSGLVLRNHSSLLLASAECQNGARHFGLEVLKA